MLGGIIASKTLWLKNLLHLNHGIQYHSLLNLLDKHHIYNKVGFQLTDNAHLKHKSIIKPIPLI